MTATRAAFVALDSASVPAIGGPVSAHRMRTLTRNANEILGRQFAPLVVHAYDVRASDSDIDSKTDDTMVELRKALRLNAPTGAWSTLIEPQWVPIPPGVTQLTLTVRAKIDSGATAYVQVITRGNPADVSRAANYSAMLALAGTGAAATYEGSFPVVPHPSGNTFVCAIMQTGTYVSDYRGRCRQQTGSDVRAIFADGTTFASIDANAVEIDDWWVRNYEATAWDYAFAYDSSGATYTDETGSLRDTTSGDVQPFASGAGVSNNGDIFYLGSPTPAQGLMLAVSTAAVTMPTVVVEYSNTSGTWSTLTRHANNGSPTYDVTDFTEATGNRVCTWDVPSDAGAVSVNGYSAHWIRFRATTATLVGTAALVTQGWRLTANAPFRRVLRAGTEDTVLTSAVSYVVATRPIDAGASAVKVYTVGRGAKAWIYAANLRPAPLSTIT